MITLGRTLIGILVVASMSSIPAFAQDGQTAQEDSLSSVVPAASVDRSRNPQKPARSVRRPKNQNGAGQFVYLIKDIVRAKSAELCAGYGGPSDCIEEIEICLTMLDEDEDVVKLCLNSEPAGQEGNDIRKTARRK
jgi:hypothetical protein